MAIRILYRSILRHSAVAPCALTFPTLRHRSSRPDKLIEIDIQSSASTLSSSEADVEVPKIRKLEEAIHALFVRKSTPDWLPFIPGSSFWVPPRKRKVDVVDLVGKLWKPSREEETLNITNRGWPTVEFFSTKGSAFGAILTEIFNFAVFFYSSWSSTGLGFHLLLIIHCTWICWKMGNYLDWKYILFIYFKKKEEEENIFSFSIYLNLLENLLI